MPSNPIKPSDARPFEVFDETAFRELIAQSCVEGGNQLKFDEMLVAALGALGDSTLSADALECPFSTATSAFSETFKPPLGFVCDGSKFSGGAEATSIIFAEIEA